MTSRCYIGIDPGFTGGIAAIVDGAPLPLLWEMPTTEFEIKRVRAGQSKLGKKTELATNRLVAVLDELKQYEPFVMVESAQMRSTMRPSGHDCPRCKKPHLYPGQGAASQAEFVGQYKEIRGVLYALHISFEAVHPATWKAEVFHGQARTSGDDESESAKEISRHKAIQLFPLLGERLALKKTHGMAEALLIAWYGKRRNEGAF